MKKDDYQTKKKWIIPVAGVILLFVLVVLLFNQLSQNNAGFDSNRALRDVIKQVNFGPRTPGSAAHTNTLKYIQNQLQQVGWDVEIQEGISKGQPVRNIIARRGKGSKWIILGAHYDSRLFADRDKKEERTQQPVPGANDGASGVAVLLELARSIPSDVDKEIWLVFFDAEDQGRIQGWDWILGSRYFVEQLQGIPDAVVVVDMIGDADLNIYREITSDAALTDEIWTRANELGFEDIFINSEKYRILDDHTPFLEAGIRAIDIIDFDYEYWHTTEDTIDKVTEESLGIIGKVLLDWLND